MSCKNEGGPIWNKILILILFWTTMVLSISLPISPTTDATLGESIFGRSEPRQEKREK